MRTRASWRWIVVVVVLVAGAAGWSAARTPGADQARSPAPRSVSVAEAVRRTRAAGSARVTARVRPREGAAAIEVTGVMSLADARADLVARRPGSAATDGEQDVGLRMTSGGAWLRVGSAAEGLGEWTAIDPAATQLSGAAQGWADLLAGLRPAAGSRRAGRGADRGAIAVTHGAATGTIDLDDAGRIRRLRLDQGRGRTLVLELSDFGVPVEVEVPPPP